MDSIPTGGLSWKTPPVWLTAPVHAPQIDARVADEVRAHQERIPSSAPEFVAAIGGGMLRDMLVSRIRDPLAYAVGLRFDPTEMRPGRVDPALAALHLTVVPHGDPQNPYGDLDMMRKIVCYDKETQTDTVTVCEATLGPLTLLTRYELVPNSGKAAGEELLTVDIWIRQDEHPHLAHLTIVTRSPETPDGPDVIQEYLDIAASVRFALPAWDLGEAS